MSYRLIRKVHFEKIKIPYIEDRLYRLLPTFVQQIHSYFAPCKSHFFTKIELTQLEKSNNGKWQLKITLILKNVFEKCSDHDFYINDDAVQRTSMAFIQLSHKAIQLLNVQKRVFTLFPRAAICAKNNFKISQKMSKCCCYFKRCVIMINFLLLLQTFLGLLFLLKMRKKTCFQWCVPYLSVA